MLLYTMVQGRPELLDDSAEQDALNQVLDAMWEEPPDPAACLLFVADNGRLAASITVIEVLGEQDGVVEVYQVGQTPRRFRITYVLSNGCYDHTEIKPLEHLASSSSRSNEQWGGAGTITAA